MALVTISDTIKVGEKEIVLNNVALSPDHPTVVYVPINDMSSSKAEAWLKTLGESLAEQYNDKYQVILIAVRN